METPLTPLDSHAERASFTPTAKPWWMARRSTRGAFEITPKGLRHMFERLQSALK